MVTKNFRGMFDAALNTVIIMSTDVDIVVRWKCKAIYHDEFC